ncbi:KAP family P-loop NTPase fold protein [Hymenobacter sp. PAMC 26628]|uniref:KAP family P-loop NTPase fold protein n=1 Tax=Hymenobacter sp. PAMC 26628 TaxID=1484118 RepID=UPI0009020410|nr:KAP family NTPase [Hymenobacter sp. PAMC 26628]
MLSTITRDTRASDRPVVSTDNDDFQRAPFAIRIAETLVARKSPDSIVVGLYGKWGEGKSTVLNFIRQALAEAADQVVVLNFNPWRFPDESQLLLNFFSELARTIGQKLEKGGERAAKALTTYLVPLIPSLSLGPASADVGKGVEALLKGALPDVEELRDRIEKLIVESGRRVVVIIDDIDRLEKKQVQAVFRLVKLTADFKQTAYLLAFDDVMVSRAIGEMFEAGAEAESDTGALQAGQNFLEKIIQVPLRLPLARPDDLLNFCYARVNEVLTDTSTNLTTEEARRLSITLRDAVLPRLRTPRLAVRYANAIVFSLPLLQNEVNPVDLLLMEAMSIFYPALYAFVARHEKELVGSIREDSGGLSSERRKQEETMIKQAVESFSSEEQTAARHLLGALFPRVDRLASTWYSPQNGHSQLTSEDLTRQQCVASPTHFARYFAYTVLSSDVADGEYAAFLSLSGAEQLTRTRALITYLGVTPFLQKLESRIPDLTIDQAWSVAHAIGQAGDLLNPTNRHGIMGTSEPTQASWVLIGLLAPLATTARRMELMQSLLQDCESFDLAFELNKQLIYRYGSEMDATAGRGRARPQLFSEAEWTEVLKQNSLTLLQRALREAGNEPLYKAMPRLAGDILKYTWPNSGFQPDVADYVFGFLDKSPTDLLVFLAACANSVSVNGGAFFQENISHETTALLTKLFGPKLYTLARQILGPEPLTEYPGGAHHVSVAPAALDRLRQFVHLYEQQAAPLAAREQSQRFNEDETI